MGYLAHFIVYFLAMIGIIILALFVYQKFNMSTVRTRKTNNLQIEDALSLSARKNLYVVRSGNERFLIAADFERTTLISKLDDNAEVVQQDINPRRVGHRVDLSEKAINLHGNVAPIKKPIMKEIRQKLNF